MSSRSASSFICRPRFGGALGAACLLSLAAPSWAAAPGGSNDSNASTYVPPETERRGGFAMGLNTGLSLVDFSGYPNRVVSLGDPAARESTGPSLGNSFSLWLGGALRDWLTVGFGLSASSAFSSEYQASTAAFLFHAEAYPFYALAPELRDLGISFDGGAGVGTMYAAEDKDLKNALSDGGSMSFLSLGAFYEPFRFWQMSTGPSLTVSHTFSQSLTITQALIGWRFVFYGDQPEVKTSDVARGGATSTF